MFPKKSNRTQLDATAFLFWHWVGEWGVSMDPDGRKVGDGLGCLGHYRKLRGWLLHGPFFSKEAWSLRISELLLNWQGSQDEKHLNAPGTGGSLFQESSSCHLSSKPQSSWIPPLPPSLFLPSRTLFPRFSDDVIPYLIFQLKYQFPGEDFCSLI